MTPEDIDRIVDGMPRPPGFDEWNRSHRGAFLRGMRASVAGRPKVSPYTDHRKSGGQLTWSRAYERCWYRGYGHASRNMPTGGGEG
jgi:hypothetical protein